VLCDTRVEEFFMIFQNYANGIYFKSRRSTHIHIHRVIRETQMYNQIYATDRADLHNRLKRTVGDEYVEEVDRNVLQKTMRDQERADFEEFMIMELGTTPEAISDKSVEQNLRTQIASLKTNSDYLMRLASRLRDEYKEQQKIDVDQAKQWLDVLLPSPDWNGLRQYITKRVLEG